MQITKEMLMELNNELTIKGCPFRYELKFSENGSTAMVITLPNMNCVDSYVINVTDDFIDWLHLWFKTKFNIELGHSNNGTLFWSNEKLAENSSFANKLKDAIHERTRLTGLDADGNVISTEEYEILATRAITEKENESIKNHILKKLYEYENGEAD